MGCFVVAEFFLTSASRGPSAIAEPLVQVSEADVVCHDFKFCVYEVRMECLQGGQQGHELEVGCAIVSLGVGGATPSVV